MSVEKAVLARLEVANIEAMQKELDRLIAQIKRERYSLDKMKQGGAKVSDPKYATLRRKIQGLVDKRNDVDGRIAKMRAKK